MDSELKDEESDVVSDVNDDSDDAGELFDIKRFSMAASFLCRMLSSIFSRFGPERLVLRGDHNDRLLVGVQGENDTSFPCLELGDDDFLRWGDSISRSKLSLSSLSSSEEAQLFLLLIRDPLACIVINGSCCGIVVFRREETGL